MQQHSKHANNQELCYHVSLVKQHGERNFLKGLKLCEADLSYSL